MSTITSGNLGINRVPFSRMLKAEVAEYAKRIINITDKQYVAESVIFPVVEKLTNTEPQIVMLGVRYGIDPMREELDNLKSQLMLSISTLKLKVRVLSKTNNDKALRLVQGYIDTYLLYLDKTKNEKELSQRIAGFIEATEAEQALSDAIDSHNLDNEIGNIRVAESDFKNRLNKRVTMLAERPRVKTQDLVKTIATAVENLFKAIEVAPIMSGEEDHTALAQELSQLSDMFNRSISIRSANNKRKNDKGEEGEEGAPEDGDGENGGNDEPMTTAMRYGIDHDDSNNGEGTIAPYGLMDTFMGDNATEELHGDDEVDDDEVESFVIE